MYTVNHVNIACVRRTMYDVCVYVRVGMFEVRRTLYGVHVYILNCNTLNSHMLYGAVFIIYCTMYTVQCTL